MHGMWGMHIGHIHTRTQKIVATACVSWHRVLCIELTVEKLLHNSDSLYRASSKSTCVQIRENRLFVKELGGISSLYRAPAKIAARSYPDKVRISFQISFLSIWRCGTYSLIRWLDRRLRCGRWVFWCLGLWLMARKEGQDTLVYIFWWCELQRIDIFVACCAVIYRKYLCDK